MSEARVFRSEFDAAAAIERVRDLAGGSPVLECQLLYPYFHFGISGRLQSLLGSRALAVECLVDARTGHAATADAFDADRVPCSDEVCLAATWSQADAARQARRYATHALGRAYRIAANLHLELSAHGIVHRPFCIVTIAGRRLLVDRVTGELHPLLGVVPAARSSHGHRRGDCSAARNGRHLMRASLE